MIAVYSDAHALHRGEGEVIDGRLVPSLEAPARAERILEHLREAELGRVVAPTALGLEPLLRVHDPAFVAFVRGAYEVWRAAGKAGLALPFAWPMRGADAPLPRSIDGQLAYYCFDAATPIGPGTWQAAIAAAHAALTAQRLVAEGARAAFALCRPPGHHAARALYGGYCFFNNAAVAAQAFCDAGARVALLDLDYHHGNGTQAVFYARSDVLFVSLHADPADEFPFFSGYADERGVGEGEGYTLNLPLALGSDWPAYQEALGVALERVRAFSPDALVVSLGFDAFAGDPLGRFALREDDFGRMGAALAPLGLPTLFVLEGGYALHALGGLAVKTLRSFMDG